MTLTILFVRRLSAATTIGGVALIALLSGAVSIAAVTIGAAAVCLLQVQPTLVWLGDLVARART